jgi:hypothetical protein
VQNGTCSANISRNFTRTVQYKSIINGNTSYVGLNSSSVNRCVSWVPATETPLVTVRVNQDDSTILATMPLRTTSILKMMAPYTILYDASMVGSRKSVQLPGQKAGIGIGIALAVIAVIIGAGMILRRSLVKSRTSKTVHQDDEAASANIHEREGILNEEGLVMNRSEAPNSEIHELKVDTNNPPPSELDAVHEISVEMAADLDHSRSELKS